MIARRSLLIGIAALAAWPARADGPQAISAEDAHSRAKSGGLVLVDVRTPGEWRRTGVPEGALTISMQDPALGEKLQAATAGRRDTPVALICATGVRSGQVATAMARAGYTQVYSVAEGMHGSAAGAGWLRRGLPLTKPE